MVILTTDTYGILIVLLSTLCLFLLLVVFCLFVWRLSKNLRWAYLNRNLAGDEEQVLRFLDEEMELSELQLTCNHATKVQIVKLAAALSGKEKTKLRLLYEHLGFFDEDAFFLRRGSYKKQVEALARLRQLEIVLPDIAWQYMLQHRSLIFRWATMEYLITVKRDKSLLWLTAFICHPMNQSQGVIQHLFSCLAKHSPESLLVLLEHAPNTMVIEQALRTLAVYPQPAAVSLVIAHLKTTESEETFIAAIKALGAAPNEKTLDLFRIAIRHYHWVVRLQIGKALQNFAMEESEDLLRILAEDSSYYVRKQAMETLNALQGQTSKLYREIAEDEDHPSNDLLHHINEMRSVA